jgi:hypothetical protein
MEANLDTTLHLAAAIALLLFGRRLFWLFVGLVGFLFGLSLAPALMHAQPQWLILTVSVLLGLLAAVAAIFMQRVAVLIAGFLTGGYLMIELLSRMNLAVDPLFWGLVAAGALVAAVFVFVLFDTALILLSSLLGAAHITRLFDMAPIPSTVLLVVLLIFGFVVQRRQIKPKRPYRHGKALSD